MSLPYPDEPTEETLRRYAGNYESGVQSFLDDDSLINREMMAKQGMIGYLWNEWKTYDLTYNEVQKGTKRANTPIGLWLDGEVRWDEVLERYESALERKIE